jgi:diadenosine tetraphosphate (Ap4A) HIT family hydrolase
MECAFCSEFVTGSDRIITACGDWLLLPTVGCFTPGYCLFMPCEHVNAVADLPGEQLHEVESAAEQMRARLTYVYGPTIIAEHGARGCDLGAGCCTHAHLHLIPVPDPGAVVADYLATGGDGASLAGICDLPTVAAGAYVYLSPRPGTHLAWPAAGFARQFVRRVCARLHGLGAFYDWRDYAFPDLQQATLQRLRGAFAGPCR